MPSELTDAKSIFERVVSTDIMSDLLVLLHRNPGLVDTKEQIARRIGRSPKSITKEITDLIDIGMLTMTQIGKLEVLKLDRKRDEEIQGVVADYIKRMGSN